MVTDDGQLKVTDFGVSRTIEFEPEGEPEVVTDLGVTRVGTIVGTPAYMAPEQAMGKEVDCRSDIYALGMTLYHMLSGDPPFKAKSEAEMLSQQMSQQPKSLFRQISELTHDQASVIERMIAKKPEDRHSNYDALLYDLKLHAPGTDQLANPLKRVAAEACNLITLYLLFAQLMVTIASIVMMWTRQDRKTLHDLAARTIVLRAER